MQVQQDRASSETHASRWRWVATFALDRTALLLLALAIAAFVVMWWSAWRMHKMPDRWWDAGGNHGPWRYLHARWGYAGLQNLRWFWASIIQLLAHSGVLGLLSLLLRPAWKRALLPLAALALGVLFFHTHHWLVD
jgi:hypothetical protein